MKKNLKFYIIIWAILLVLYNLTVFLVRPVMPGYIINYDARFWISWGVIIATFIGQLFCAKVAFDSKNNEKLFLNIPLITQSYTALVVATIAGSAYSRLSRLDCRYRLRGGVWFRCHICYQSKGCRRHCQRYRR